MKRIVLPWMLLASMLLTVVQAEQPAAEAVVRVQLNDHLLQFSQYPRLQDVLQYADVSADTYWPAAALYQLDAELLQRQQLFLAQLLELRQYYLDRSRQQQANAIQLLWLQVSQWQLAKRIAIPIDKELSRVQWPFNPRLDEGDYLLMLGKRPAYVHLSGLYQETAPELHRRAADARHYLLPGYRLPLADRSWVMLVHPDGATETIGVAYWNRMKQSLAPGSQIVVPFAPRALPKSYRHLADELLTLAANRVLPE